MSRKKRRKIPSERVLAQSPPSGELVAEYFSGAKPQPAVGMSLPATDTPPVLTDASATPEPAPDGAAPALPSAPPPALPPPAPAVAAAPPPAQKKNMGIAPPSTLLPEIPGDLIRDLGEKNGNATVFIRFSRRSPADGKPIILGNAHMQTFEVLHIDQWLGERAGGGEYYVEVRDLTERANLLVPKFRVGIEGVPKKFVQSYTVPDGPAFPGSGGWFAGIPGASPPPQPVPAGYIPMEMQGGQMQYPYGYPAPGYGLPAAGPVMQPGLSADRVAMKQVDDLKAEIVKITAERDTERTKAETAAAIASRDVADRDRTIATLREDIRDMKHKHDIELLRAERSSKNGESGFDVAKLLVALAPVMGTYLQTNATRDTDTMKMIVAGQQKEDSIAKYLPIVMPVVLKMIESRSPAEQAQVLSTMFDAQAQNAALTAQIIQNMAAMSGGEAPWVPLVQQLIGSGAEAIGKMVDAKQSALRQGPMMVHGGRAAPLPPPQQQPVPAQAVPTQPQMVDVPVNPGSYQTIPDDEVATTTPANGQAGAAQPIITPAPVSDVPTRGTQIAIEMSQHALFPAAFKDEDWLEVIRDIHDGKDVGEVAVDVIELVEAIEEDQELPVQLLTWRTQTERTFTMILSLLPVAKENPPYTAALLAAIVQGVAERNANLAESTGIVPAHGEPVS
jgi:hypothetical protein